MENLNYDDKKDIIETLEDLANKLNEIIDWINEQ